MPPPSAIPILVLSAACWVGMIRYHAAGYHCFICGSFVGDLFAWMLMVGAMMLPMTLPAIDDVSRRTYRQQRVVATSEYVIGYLSCWAVAGMVFAVLRLHPLMHERFCVVLACLLAALWALLPARRIWFVQCHVQIPLCPVGWRAHWDAFRQGATQGIPCVKMCWVLMVACGISGHDWVMMIGGTVLAIREKRMFRLNRATLVVGSLILAVWFLGARAMESHHQH